MSSDYDFGDEIFDESALKQIEAIEAAHVTQSSASTSSSATLDDTQPVQLPNSNNNNSSDSSFNYFDDADFELNEAELQEIDRKANEAYQGRPQHPPMARTRQLTLDGNILADSSVGTSKTSRQKSFQRTKSTNETLPDPQQSRKTKQWDHTEFAKSGIRSSSKAKGKGKGKANYHNEEEEEWDEPVEFEQFPAPFVPVGPPPPMKLVPDLIAAKHWIFPNNQERRDYQYNIVRHCLFDNTIVALPTGLGKTFIAGCVMLNFYRWFPEGKVVFVAPTKPLVAQQVEACHRTCGIPGSDAIELTGETPKVQRARQWKEKRVFYMTPQTLVNDLVGENCEVSDIVLLVVDEAHRATGDYAYNQVVRFLMAKNPHFRLLALTATPGSTPDAVQNLVDGLHISRIEIRDENSLDLRQYIHEKVVTEHIIHMNEDVNKVVEPLEKLMQDVLKPLRDKGIMFTNNLVKMHSYAPQAKMQTLDKNSRWAYAPLSKLSSLARAMGYLVEGTMGMCYSLLHELSDEPGGDSQDAQKKAQKAKSLKNDPTFQSIMKEIESQRSRGFTMHPKMDCLKRLVLDHFGKKLDDDGKPTEETRAMVFVTFREAVDEIVTALNVESPLVKATQFIGQGTDKKGKKGMSQKEQLEVIKKFKGGEFNVLVATSIGEEGLDIGEVDLIICYDAQKTPIRMLQRSGRTGRKRAGVVHVLLSAEREKENWATAKDGYKHVQKSIIKGEDLELYGDVPRLLPENIKPECREQMMEIELYVREDSSRKRSRNDSSEEPKKKRKRNNDPMRNIPAAASSGFVPVSKLVAKGGGAKKRKTKTAPVDFYKAGEDGESDKELEEGTAILTRRTQSAVEPSSSRGKKGSQLKRAATTAAGKARKTKKSRKEDVSQVSLSQQGQDDSDDMEFERDSRRMSMISQGKQFVDLSDEDSAAEHESMAEAVGGKLSNGFVSASKVHRKPLTSSKPISVASLSNSETSDSDDCLPESSTLNSKLPELAEEDKGEVIDLTDSEPESDDAAIGGDAAPVPTADASMAWLLDEDDEPSLQMIDSSPINTGADSVFTMPTLDDETEIVGSPSTARSPLAVDLPKSRSRSQAPFRDSSNLAMPPPSQLPARFSMRNEEDSFGPEPTFAVRPVGKIGKRRIDLPINVSSSPEIEALPLSQRRLQRVKPVSPSRPRGKKVKKPKVQGKKNPLFDFEAEHSGEEVSEGSSNSEDDEESESDRAFLNDGSFTQVSTYYDQKLAYRQSLMTQAPAGPEFVTGPSRRGAFGRGSFSNRRRPQVSSSPPRTDGSDHYLHDSFVVDDDEAIVYSDSSQ